MKLFKSNVPYAEPSKFESSIDAAFVAAHHGEIEGKYYLSLDDLAVADYKAAQPADGGLTAVSTQAEKDKVKAASRYVARAKQKAAARVLRVVESSAYKAAMALGEEYGADEIEAAKAERDAAIELVFPSAS